jgi:hypothetical protein
MDNARDLADRLASLLRREQGALADFLLALADFDARRLWVPLGYTSLFHFLHRHLGMSKGAAHCRKTAAELIQHHRDPCPHGAPRRAPASRAPSARPRGLCHAGPTVGSRRTRFNG